MRSVPDARPYPWPWNGDIDLAHLALLVTGWDDHWSSATAPDPTVMANIRRLSDAVPTITISHHPPRRRPAGRRPTTRPDLQRISSLTAAGIDGFFGSELGWMLRELGVRQLVLSGLGLETTVHSTLRRANDMGFECLLVTDACAPVDPSLVAGAISSIEMSGGIFGAVAPTDALLAAI